MFKKKFHIILLMLIWNFSLAQEFINYRIKDGLPSNRVYRLTQDNEGFIWAITDKGMAKFNGREFKVFNTRNGLPTNDIWDIRVDKKNRVWFFSKASILGYIENERVHTFLNCESEVVMFPSSTNRYGDTMVFGNANNWFYLEKDCWKIMSLTNMEQPENNYFKTLHKSALHLAKDTAFQQKTFLRFRNQDSIMVMLYNEGFSVVNLLTDQIYPREFKQYASNLNPNFIRNHFVNNQIQITGFDFVGILDENYEMDQVVKIPSDLNAYFSMVDKTGNVWCATFSRGIFMLPQVKRNCSYGLEHQKVDQIKKVGNRVFANVYNKGFYEYDSLQKSFKPFILDKSFVFNAVYIDSLKSAFFSSEMKSIQIINNDGNHRKLDYFTKIGGVRSLVYHNGFLYGNVSAGVMKIDTETFEETKMYDHYGVLDLLVFNDSLFLATSDGLKKLFNDSISSVDIGAGLSKKPVLSLAKVTDTLLLVNTDGHGAYLTDLKTAKLLPKSEFLSVESAYVSKNVIWLATEKGILKYEKAGSEYRYLGILNENDGLPSKKVNSVIEVGKDLLVSTDDGVVILPIALEKKIQFLKIYIENAQFNQTDMSAVDPSVRYTTNNSIDFSISAIDFSTSLGELQYSYRLLPLQKKWTQTTARSLNFSSLPPNQYILELRAGSLAHATHFNILPLWWQRPLAKGMFWLVGFLFVGFILYYLRNREISKKTAKLSAQKKMAEYELYALRTQMNPHFVFNSLAAIQYYINNNDFETSEKYLVKFSKLIRQFFELSKESEIPLETEIKLLKNYLDIEILRFKEKLDYKVKIDPALDLQKTTIPTMLLQPIVENAVNHGIFNKEKNGRINLNFTKKDEKEILVEILDNGVGFKNSKQKVNGKVSSSAVLKNRIEVLNSSKQWEIQYYNAEVFPEKTDVGNIATFKIKKIQ
ncbi:MAG: histidine kinase [Aequorivita sp.]|nr:histidine kinase [Aequorivita sp.]